MRGTQKKIGRELGDIERQSRSRRDTDGGVPIPSSAQNFYMPENNSLISSMSPVI